MKIAIINNYSPSSGVGRYALELFYAVSRIRRDWDVNLLFTYNFPNFKPTGYKVIYLTRLKESPITKMTNYFINAHRVKQKYNLCHIAAQSLGIYCKHLHPSIVTVHDLFPLESSFRPSTKFLASIYRKLLQRSILACKHSSYIITDSDFIKKEVISKLNYPHYRISTIPLGVNAKIFKPAEKNIAKSKMGLSNNHHYLLYVGNELDTRKNVDTLIMAFAKLKKMIPNLVMIKVSPQSWRINSLIYELKLGDSIICKHGLTDNEIALLYSAADVSVLPSLAEGFGLTALEAMASGCPLVASNSTSIPEVVGDAAILVNPLSIQEIVDAVASVLLNREINDMYKQKGIERSREFTWTRCAKEVIKVYENYMDQN